MGTPIRSERDTPPEPLEDSTEQPPNPNPNPSDGVTDGDPPPEDEVTRLSRYTGILEATLREQNATIQRLNESHAAPAPTPTPAPAPVDPSVARQEFYNDPAGATRRTIREELETTVKPLLDFVQEFKGQGLLGTLKAKMKADARFAPHWDAAVEQAVDETLSRLQPSQINEQTMQSAVVQAIGLKTMGLLSGSTAPAPTPAPSPTPTPTRVPSTPPHMRPSAPPAPGSGNGAKKLRPLTENEERLRREQKMSHEEYLFWLDVPANEVATAKFKPTGAK